MNTNIVFILFLSTTLVSSRTSRGILSTIVDKLFGPWITRQSSPLSTQPPSLSFLLMDKYLSNNVVIQNTNYLGRDALKVSFSEGYQKYVTESGLVQGNGFVEVPLTNFYSGTIDVDIAAVRNRYADENGRAFAGIVFRKQSNDQFECVYLRMTNGLLNAVKPPVERMNRAVQYISAPQWTFENLRNQFPDQYEAAANIGEKRWNHLRILVQNNSVSVFIDSGSTPVFQRDLLGVDYTGGVAYWVDDATDAYFSNLKIQEF